MKMVCKYCGDTGYGYKRELFRRGWVRVVKKSSRYIVADSFFACPKCVDRIELNSGYALKSY